MAEYFTLAALGGFLTLTLLEIVLGIDNLIVIAIVTDRLPEAQRPKARQIGLALALIIRVVMLFGIGYLVKATAPLMEIGDYGLSIRDLVMLAGGGFLIYKSTTEIYKKVEAEEEHGGGGSSETFSGAIAQIVALDVVFSLDSVITAVGLVKHIPIMVAAVLVAMGVMLAAANTVGDYIRRHPSLKILALSFILMIGMMLVLEGFHQHVPKGYVYAAMAFSMIVEVLNMRFRGKKKVAVAH